MHTKHSEKVTLERLVSMKTNDPPLLKTPSPILPTASFLWENCEPPFFVKTPGEGGGVATLSKKTLFRLATLSKKDSDTGVFL